MNWLQELCTADEYCIKCKQEYKGGTHHACSKDSKEKLRKIKQRTSGAKGITTLSVIDAATWKEVAPDTTPRKAYVDETAEAMKRRARTLQERGVSDADILAELNRLNETVEVSPYHELSYTAVELGAMIPARPKPAAPTQMPAKGPETQATSAYGVKPASPASPFKLPVVEGGDWDYVIAPAPGQVDGWFPRGDLSLIGGSSGTNKSTLILDLLEKQSRFEKFLGHETFGLPYLVLMTDRGVRAHRRTMKRMHLDDIPAERIRSGTGEKALRDIVNKLEGTSPMPAILFLEGVDMMVEDAVKMHLVSPFVDGLQKIAQHYHVAIIGSLGAAKFKQGEGYITKRDSIFGSIAWGRKAETIVTLQYPAEEDDTTPRRELTVLLRNGPAESFSMILRNGRLELATEQDKKEALAPELAWFMAQTADPEKEWWVVSDLEAGLKTSTASAHRKVKDALAKHYIRKKPGPKEGASEQYQWNDDTATNPALREKFLAKNLAKNDRIPAQNLEEAPF